ncbi:MAG: ABC transporter ATP-binding protein, partial [Desulfofustis sp.]|nr:ABC transporter ATP-binding protein [Desulfofustis sp.]
MMPILEVNNLHKQYKRITAVADVSFAVREGSCFGLLGPNGAGKTTTMEMIEDIIEPTSGTILYRGNPRKDSFKQEIGIQFQHTSLLNFLSVEETLVCYRGLYQKPEDLDWLIRRCDLQPILQQRNHQLSGGQRQRLMLALALVNRPELMFLDEPSTGLDPQSRRYLWDIVKDIKEAGKTVILTTHSMEEAQILCDTVAIMDRGRIIAEDSPAGLIDAHCRTNTISLPRGTPVPDLGLPSGQLFINDAAVTIRTDDVNETLHRLMKEGVDLSEMKV